MKYLLITLALLSMFFSTKAQQIVTIVKDSTTQQAGKGGATDTVPVGMQPKEKILNEVVISSTRTNSRIENLPMKVEVLGQDDMNEESGIKPGNVASILGDLSVIHIQNTSAVNGNNAIRMQGLDGKYTQLLRDGMPVYEGLSGNFGVLAIPPLDLKQIEIIKGSVSTLYGGGAIAGMINFIAKTPGSKPELTVLVNHSSLKENNVNTFYSQKWEKTGLTLFAGATTQNASDVNKDGFSDVPRVRQYTVHPRFFWYINPNTTLVAGYTGTIEKREGGDMQVLSNTRDSVHQYTESNNSHRHSVDLQFSRRQLGGGTLTLKGVGSFYHLENTEGTFALNGNQSNLYAEAAYNKKTGRNNWVIGVNNTGELYRRAHGDSSVISDYTYNTVGFFAQDGFDITKGLMAEAGIRADHHNIYGWYFLPRLALVYKPVDKLSIRLSAGSGYKTPAIFTSQTQSIAYKELLPLTTGMKAERSTGINFDAAYHTSLGPIDVIFDQALYYTHIEHPILPVVIADGKISLENQAYAVRSLGTDTYIRLSYEELELYLGYNHTTSKYTDAANTFVPFAPRDKFASTLAYEIPEKWRFGIESSWAGNQYLYNNEKAPNYWFWAAMASRQLGSHFTVVLNCENIFDARQGKHAPLYTGSTAQPQFLPLWGPIDGRAINLSIKYTL